MEDRKTKRKGGDRKLLSGDTVTVRVHISLYKFILENNQGLETISETIERLLKQERS